MLRRSHSHCSVYQFLVEAYSENVYQDPAQCLWNKHAEQVINTTDIWNVTSQLSTLFHLGRTLLLTMDGCCYHMDWHLDMTFWMVMIRLWYKKQTFPIVLVCFTHVVCSNIGTIHPCLEYVTSLSTHPKTPTNKRVCPKETLISSLHIWISGSNRGGRLQVLTIYRFVVRTFHWKLSCLDVGNSDISKQKFKN